MSIDAYVFSDEPLSSLREWQRAIDAERLNIVLPADGLIRELHGFLPVDSNGVATGFECGIGIENFNDIKVGDVIEAFVMEQVAATL